MAKPFTLYGSTGLSKYSGKSTINRTKIDTKPSEKALRFVLDYAKSSSVLKTKSIDSIIIVNN